jgi:hypothetical protein
MIRQFSVQRLLSTVLSGTPMPRWLQLSSRRVRLLLPVLVGLWACNAPFIPVPPPDNVFVQESLTDGSGSSRVVWITQGKPDSRAAGAKFFIYNQALNSGVIIQAGADGSYVAPPLEGTMGDHVFVSYMSPNGDDSEVACRLLVEGDPAPECPR